MKEVLQLLKKEKYGFPANIELEYRYPGRLEPHCRNEEVPGLLQGLPGLNA